MTLLKDNNYKEINVALLSLEADIKNKITNFDTSVIDKQLAEINSRIDKINAGGNNTSAEINDIRYEIEDINSKLNGNSAKIENIEQKLTDIFSAENKVTDFNTTIDSGIYYWVTDAANKPTDYGVLLVNKYDGGSASIWINQIAYGTNSKIYFRQNINSGNWTEWKAVAFDGETTAYKVSNALTVNGKTYDGSEAVDAGVQKIENGGTGATTAKEAEYNIVVPTQNATIDAESITDESRWTGTYVSPSKTTGRLYTKKFNVVWEYIKGKISSVLGLTKDNYGGKAATAGTADKVANALTVNGKTYDGSSAVDTGVQTVANGGTGVTTQEDINKAFISNLGVGNDNVTDGTEFVSSWASDNGFADSNALNTPYKRQFIKVWNYIKGKISSVLGLTKDNYGGTADKATNDGDGNNIVNTYALKSNLQYTKSVNINKLNGSSNTWYYLIAKTPSSNTAGNIDSLFVNGSDYKNRMFEGSIQTRDGNAVCNYGKDNLPIELYEQTDGTIYVYWLVRDAYDKVALNLTATMSITTYGGNLSHVTPTGSKMTLTEYDYKCYKTLPIARGGTGVTTQADINKAFINNLEAGNSDVTDGTEFVSSYATDNGFADPSGLNKPYKRQFIKVWNYIKGKISSVLGLTKDNYGGKASTAGTADKTKNDITIDIHFVKESGQYVIPLGNILEPTSTEINSPYNWDITGFFSIIRPTGHNGSHLWFEAGHGYSHDWTTYAYLDKMEFRGVVVSIKAFQYEGKWWLGLCINTPNQGYSSKMTITYSRGLPATPTCILYNSKSNGVANEEIYNSIQDIPSSWWKTRTIDNPTTFTRNITAPVIQATANFTGNLTGNVTGKADTAGTANKVANTLTINGQSFDGSSALDINIYNAYDHIVYNDASLLEWANCTDGSMKKVLIKSGTYNMTKGVDFSKAGTGYVLAENGAVINSKVPVAFTAPSGKTAVHNLKVVCGPSSDNSCAFSASDVLNLILYDCEASYATNTITVNRNLFSHCTCYNCHYNFTNSSSNSSISLKVFYQCYCYNCICKQTISANSSSGIVFGDQSYFYKECVCVSCDAELTTLRNIKAANPTFSCYYNCWDRCVGCLSKINVNSSALTVYSTLYGFLRCQHMSSCKEVHTVGYTNIKGVVQCIYISSTSAVSGESNTSVGNSCDI